MCTASQELAGSRFQKCEACTPMMPARVLSLGCPCLCVCVCLFFQKRAAMDPLFRHAMMAQQGVRPGGALALLSSMFAADKAEAARKAEDAATAAAIAAAEGGAGGSGSGGGGGGGGGGTGGGRQSGRLHTPPPLCICFHT